MAVWACPDNLFTAPPPISYTHTHTHTRARARPDKHTSHTTHTKIKKGVKLGKFEKGGEKRGDGALRNNYVMKVVPTMGNKLSFIKLNYNFQGTYAPPNIYNSTGKITKIHALPSSRTLVYIGFYKRTISRCSRLSSVVFRIRGS